MKATWYGQIFIKWNEYYHGKDPLLVEYKVGTLNKSYEKKQNEAVKKF